MSSVTVKTDDSNVNRKQAAADNTVNPLINPTGLCRTDLTAAHQPESMVSTAKFGSTGQPARSTVSTFISRGCMFYFEHGEPVRVQSPGFIRGLYSSLARFLSMNVCFLSPL